MKRAGELVLIIMLLLAMLCSCVSTRAEGQSGDVGTEGPTETEPPETTEPTESGPTETEPTEPTTEPEEPLDLNQDLIADFGMSYSQLKEKHGELMDHGTAQGSVYYIFEHGYGYYYWLIDEVYDTDNLSNPVYDEHGILIFALPGDQLKCTTIKRIKVKDLFNKEFNTIDISEVKNIDGVEHLSTYKDDVATCFNYSSSFSYTGFKNEKTELILYHNDKERLDLDSEAEFVLWSWK